ncbi:MAG: hypothetical protein WA902_08495 [Thermosynechococcaceae cyanobacterium]
MTPDVLSRHAQVQTLQVPEVVTYLRKNDWMSISHPNRRFLVFEKGVDDQDKPIQIVLPSKNDYEDTPYLLAKAVNLLSFLESMSFQETVNSIHDTSVQAR